MQHERGDDLIGTDIALGARDEEIGEHARNAGLLPHPQEDREVEVPVVRSDDRLGRRRRLLRRHHQRAPAAVYLESRAQVGDGLIVQGTQRREDPMGGSPILFPTVALDELRVAVGLVVAANGREAKMHDLSLLPLSCLYRK